MTQETINRIHRIYGIVCGAVAVVAGICFILSAYSLYPFIQIHVLETVAKPQQAYTYETIGTAFSRIAIPVYLCLALVIGGIILNAIWPQTRKKVPAEKNLPLILARLQAKTDLNQCSPTLRRYINKECAERRLYALIGIILTGIATLVFLIYALNPANWLSEIVQSDAFPHVKLSFNFSMSNAFSILCLCFALPLEYCIFYTYYRKYSLMYQINLMRQANTAAPGTTAVAAPVSLPASVICIAKYAILVLAIAILIYGACTGGTADVLGKANRICTECIGLG